MHWTQRLERLRTVTATAIMRTLAWVAMGSSRLMFPFLKGMAAAFAAHWAAVATIGTAQKIAATLGEISGVILAILLHTH